MCVGTPVDVVGYIPVLSTTYYYIPVPPVPPVPGLFLAACGLRNLRDIPRIGIQATNLLHTHTYRYYTCTQYIAGRHFRIFLLVRMKQ